MALFFETNT